MPVARSVRFAPVALAGLTLLGLGVLTSARPAMADTIYQYRDAQGHLVISDEKPPASARQVQVRKDVSSSVNGPSPAGSNPGGGVPLPSHANAPVPPSGPSGMSAAPTVPVSTGDANQDAMNQRQDERARQQADQDTAVDKAQADLDAALQDQKTGQVVQDGEQTYQGYAETYEQRQQAMADRVAQAQAALLNAQVAAKP